MFPIAWRWAHPTSSSVIIFIQMVQYCYLLLLFCRCQLLPPGFCWVLWLRTSPYPVSLLLMFLPGNSSSSWSSSEDSWVEKTEKHQKQKAEQGSWAMWQLPAAGLAGLIYMQPVFTLRAGLLSVTVMMGRKGRTVMMRLAFSFIAEMSTIWLSPWWKHFTNGYLQVYPGWRMQESEN